MRLDGRNVCAEAQRCWIYLETGPVLRPVFGQPLVGHPIRWTLQLVARIVAGTHHWVCRDRHGSVPRLHVFEIDGYSLENRQVVQLVGS